MLKTLLQYSRLLLPILLVGLVLISTVSPVAAQVRPMEDVIGGPDGLAAPPGVDEYQADSGADIGILYFISGMIKLLLAAGGVFTLFMFVIAGYKMLFSGGKSGSFSEASGFFTNGVIGLALIASSYTIVAVVSYIIFGDATFVLNPRI